MHRRKLWLCAGVVFAALALAATGSARVNGAGSVSAAKAGTLIFGAEQGGGPDWCLNLILDVDCNAFWNVVFQTPVIRGAFLFTPSFKYKPDLISRYTLKHNPQRVTYYIRKNAKWSDGVQVTAKDWRFTWQTAMNTKYKDHIDPLGWQDISSVKGNGKVVTVTFKRNFAAWQQLFGYVLPQHALAGTDMLTVWNDCICNPKKGNAPIADGPFLLTKFDRGSGITLEKNTRGWYGKPAKLSSIVFRFITNTNSEIQAIRGGEVDAIYPQPQLALADLKGQAGLKIQTHLSLSWEHIEIQQGSKGNPLAKQKWLRQALITGLNRQAAAKALYGTLNPKVGVLNSLVRLTNEPTYNPKNFNKWNYNATKVANMMRAHNCTKGSDGIYSCNGTEGVVPARVHGWEQAPRARLHDLPGSGGESRDPAEERVHPRGHAVRQPPARAQLRPGDVHAARHGRPALRRERLLVRSSGELHGVLQPHGDEAPGAVGPGAEPGQAAGADRKGRHDPRQRRADDPAVPAADVLRLQVEHQRHGRQPE